MRDTLLKKPEVSNLSNDKRLDLIAELSGGHKDFLLAKLFGILDHLDGLQSAKGTAQYIRYHMDSALYIMCKENHNDMEEFLK